MNEKQLFECGENLLSKRLSLLSLWQEIADNFYPERADFTITRALGTEFAANLMTSYPLLARRDLANTLGTMLRPTAKEWFHIRTEGDDTDIEARRWLEWASGTMRRAMYDRVTQFVRATKEGDNDFAAFGQCVISIELNKRADALLYRCWHLRDVAWAENEEGKIAQVFRKWKPTCRDLMQLFPGTCPKEVTDMASKDPWATIECRHIVVQSDMFDGPTKGPKMAYTSIYWDVDHAKSLETVGIPHQMYVIPRWQTVSGSQYAFSPATVAALPDARLIQAMTSTLLEAGEKMVTPPMIAVQEAIRSDLNLFSGGVTWVDSAYDERLGEVLRPITQDKGGMPLGVEMARDCRAMIVEAFYLNKLTMQNPARGKAEMTAFEVGQMVQEYIRDALPIFEPMEMDYNGGLCDETFGVMFRAGAFGSPYDMPRSLRGKEIQFRFESPLHDAIESQKSHKLLEAKALLADAIALDPTAAKVVNVNVALRDALLGIRAPATWIRTDEEVAAIEQAQAQAAQTQQLLANVQAGATAAKTVGEAQQALAA